MKKAIWELTHKWVLADKYAKRKALKHTKGFFMFFSYIKFNLSIIRVPLYIGDIPLPMQVNAAFPFYVYLQNSRHLDATYHSDNQHVAKSYKNPVAFSVFDIFDSFLSSIWKNDTPYTLHFTLFLWICHKNLAYLRKKLYLCSRKVANAKDAGTDSVKKRWEI